MLSDADGNVIDTVNVNGVLPVLGPGQTAPVSGTAWGVGPGDFRLGPPLRCEGGAVEAYGPEGLELRDVVTDQKTDRVLELHGVVANTTDQPLAGVEVSVLVFHADGRYAGSAYDLVNAAIPAGKTARWSIFGTTFNLVGLRPGETDYRVQLWAGRAPNVVVTVCPNG